MCIEHLSRGRLTSGAYRLRPSWEMTHVGTTAPIAATDARLPWAWALRDGMEIVRGR